MRTASNAALLAALLIGGCGGGSSEHRTITAADGSKVEVDAGKDGGKTTVTATGANGEKATFTSGTGGSWPAGAPDYVAAYPGATVTSSMTGASGDGTGAMVSFTTSDSADKVIDFYKSRAAAAGLSKTSVVESGGTHVFGASDDKGRSISVQASGAGGTTSVVVTFGAKKP
jgi:hypothetical protein